MDLTYDTFKAWLGAMPPESRPCAVHLPHKNLGCACPIEVFAYETFSENINVCFDDCWFWEGGDVKTAALPTWAVKFTNLVDDHNEGPWESQTAASMLEKLNSIGWDPDDLEALRKTNPVEGSKEKS